MATTTQRGYGAAHQQERSRWLPVVLSGEADCTELVCLFDDRRIYPDDAWDLAHDRRTGGYLGPAHASCNRSEGARHVNAHPVRSVAL